MSNRSKNLCGQNVLPFPNGRAAATGSFETKPRLPVLLVLHQETSTPGRVGSALRALGHPLDIRRPRFGELLPGTLDGHAGAVIFGGPMSANDNEDYVRAEIDWIEIRCASSARSWVFAWARKCSPDNSTRASHPIRRAMPKSA